MSRVAKRRIAAFVSALLAASLSGAPSAVSAEVSPQATPPAARPVPAAGVDVTAKGSGARVRWHDVSARVDAVEVWRTNGSTTENLTPEGHRGGSFVDRTAVAGTTYSYTVKVKSVLPEAKRPTPSSTVGSRRTAPKPGSVIGSDEITMPAEADAQRADSAQARSAASAQAAAAREGGVDWRNLIPGGAKAAKAAGASSKGAAPASHSGACDIDGGGSAVTLGAGTTTWSPATCPEGYQVNADVVVPVGSTLVVQPGTVVYFNLGSTGDDADGIAAEVDLLIEGGTLVADGAPGSPVTFTSLDEHPIDSTGTPNLGDWGAIAAFEGSNVTFDHVAVRFGTGVAFVELAPAITSSTIEQMSGGLGAMPYRTGSEPYPTVVDYFNPPGFSTVNVSNSAIRGHDATYGLSVYSPDLDVNTFGVNLTGNTINSLVGLLALDEAGDASSKIDAQLVGNTLTSIGDGYASLIIPITIDGEDENTTTGSAVLTGVLSGNNIVADDGYGFIHGPASDHGDVEHLLSYVGNSARSYDYAAFNFAESETGDALIAYGVDGGSYRSQSSSAWYDEATTSDDADGASPASALVALGFNGVTLESVDSYGLEVYSDADEGNSETNVDVQSSNFSGWYDGIYAEAYNDASDNGGDETADYTSVDNILNVANSNISSIDDEAIEMYAYSSYGSTLLQPDVMTSNLLGKDGSIYGYAYGYGVDDDGDGGTVLLPTVTGSFLNAPSDDTIDLYGYRYDAGTVDVLPEIVDSLLVAGDGDGLYVDTDADDGALSLVPVFSNSTVSAADTGIYLYGYNYGGHTAHATPYILGTDVTAGDGNALNIDIYAYDPGSAAKSLPYVVGSPFKSTEDDTGVSTYAESDDGFVQAGGTFLGSSIWSTDEGSYFESYRYGTNVDGPGSITDPIFNGTHVTGTNDQAIETYSYNAAGSAAGVPAVYNGTLTAPEDYGLDVQVYGQSDVPGSYIYGGPTVSNVDINSGDGIEIYVGDNYAGGEHQAIPHAGGNITNSSILADWDYGVYSYAYTFESTAGSLVDTNVFNTPVSSYDGLYFEADSYGCYESGACEPTDSVTGDAIARPRVQYTQPMPIEGWWDYAVGVGAWSYNNAGEALADPEIRGATMLSTYGVDLWSYAYENDATTAGSVVDNRVMPYTTSDGDGIATYSETQSGFTSVLNTVIAGNQITGVTEDGVAAYAGVPAGDEDVNLLVAGNFIGNVGDDGIEVETNGNTGDDDVAHIVRNVIDRTQSTGIDLDGVMADVRSNDQSRSGWQTSSSGQSDHTGIMVASQPEAGGLVACNTVAMNLAGITYSGNPENGDPATNENNFKDQAGNTNRPLNLSTDNTGSTDATGNWWGVTGTAIDDTVDGNDVDTTPARDDTACRGGYELDGYGAAHPYGPGTASVTSGPYFGFDIANAIAVRGDGASGYVLDGFGGVHSFNGAPAMGGGPYFGFDAARDIALREDGESGYLLDLYGAVHPLGGAPAVAVSKYTAGQDLARRLVLRPDGKTGWVVFANGELAEFAPTGIVVPEASGPIFGGDVARDVVVNNDGRSGYVLDSRGALHAFNTAYGVSAPTISGPYFGFDIARAATWFNNGARIVLDGYGGLHLSKSNTAPLNTPTPFPYFGWDIARDLEGRR